MKPQPSFNKHNQLLRHLVILALVGLIIFVGHYAWRSIRGDQPAKATTSAERLAVAKAVNEHCQKAGRDGIMLIDFNNTDQFRLVGNAARLRTSCIEFDENPASRSQPLIYTVINEDKSWKVLSAGEQPPACDKVDGHGVPVEVLERCLEPSGSARAPK